MIFSIAPTAFTIKTLFNAGRFTPGGIFQRFFRSSISYICLCVNKNDRCGGDKETRITGIRSGWDRRRLKALPPSRDPTGSGHRQSGSLRNQKPAQSTDNRTGFAYLVVITRISGRRTPPTPHRRGQLTARSRSWLFRNTDRATPQDPSPPCLRFPHAGPYPQRTAGKS